MTTKTAIAPALIASAITYPPQKLMDEQRQQAYLKIVEALLQTESSEDIDIILQTHPELVDEGLVITLRDAEKVMIKNNHPDTEWLISFTDLLTYRLGLKTKSNPDELNYEIYFLITILKAISEGDGSYEEIHLLFRNNLHLINEKFISIMEIWVHQKFEEFDEEGRQFIATVIVLFANRIQKFPLGNRGINLEIAINCYQLALEVRTRMTFPEEWAHTQNNLAVAYGSRTQGERAANLEESISCYRLALEVRTRAAYPKDWAITQMSLAVAYSTFLDYEVQ